MTFLDGKRRILILIKIPLEIREELASAESTRSYMNYTIQEYYHETIQTYREEHLTEDYRAIQVIQILAPDLSCIDCYLPRRTSRCQPFRRFWN